MRVVVVGCGRHGAELARTLSMRGHMVTVIDQNQETFGRLGPSPSVQTVTGVGFDRDVLVAAGIQRADGLAAVTGSDEVNVVVARTASQLFHVPRVVARLYDPRKADIYRRLGLHTIAPVSWGVNRIAELLVYAELDVVVSLGNGDVEMIEVSVPTLLTGRSPASLQIPGEVQVTAIRRNGRTFLPDAGAHFEQGDVAYLTVRARSIGRVQAMLSVGQ